MLRIRHAHTQAEIAGTARELAAVGAALEALAVRGGTSCIACDAAGDPRPFEAVCAGLRLRRDTGPDRVALTDEGLLLSGTSEGLRRLASLFAVPEAAEPGDHRHHEHLPGDDHVSPESLPLAVVVAPPPPSPEGRSTP